MTFDSIIDAVTELLENPQFKSFGALRKHKYQMSKPQEDKEIRSITYSGVTVLLTEEQKKKKKKFSPEELERISKKISESRKKFYRNPENLEKFRIITYKRDYKLQKKKEKLKKAKA